ncbi:uncharacterized protein LOC115388423 [Salarias fasciatus]|uniref:uncharacterized protein LOC115388423 n=1 Tax=Salarias fasciatus TaxID=181472 RepID=UPI0011768E05|nr:uncharacterized protein LOC115388423 [Salarias fasciatus]
METFESLGVKIPNAILVDGITESDSCDSILTFLESYGAIKQHLIINDRDSDYFGRLVVEYESGSAFASFPSLPYTYKPGKGNKFFIESLSDIYASEGCATKTETFMRDAKNMAKLSGKEYGEILQEMLSQIQKSIADLDRPAADVDAGGAEQSTPSVSVNPSQSTAVHATSASRPSFVPHAESTQREERRSTTNVTASDLTPPEVQRYVVEHVVRSGDGAHSSHRFRTFSGKVPRPAHETDYDTWRAGVELVLRDPAISDLQRTRLIRDSLLPPAADIVKHLSPDTLPWVYLQQLESAYGTVQDGDELYAKFLDTYQDAGEKPSTYLQRLQVALQHAVRRGGVSERDVDKRLLTQFCRGCWDNNLLVELQLKQKKSNPPPFAELLLLLRTEEDQDATKNMRMKQHLGATRQKVTSHSQVVRAEEEPNLCSTIMSFTKQLTEQMAAIQKQLAGLTASQARMVPHTAMKTFKGPRASNPKSTPSKPGFCFRCGEDGHIKPQCENPPNSSLVSVKRKQFSDKQKWQHPRTSGHLN